MGLQLLQQGHQDQGQHRADHALQQVGHHAAQRGGHAVEHALKEEVAKHHPQLQGREQEQVLPGERGGLLDEQAGQQAHQALDDERRGGVDRIAQHEVCKHGAQGRGDAREGAQQGAGGQDEAVAHVGIADAGGDLQEQCRKQRQGGEQAAVHHEAELTGHEGSPLLLFLSA